jgi:hypothetical protein
MADHSCQGDFMTSPIDDVQTLRKRLDQMEQGHQRLRRFGLFAFLGIGVTLLMGQAGRGIVPEVIEAQRFVVKDASGKSIAALGADRDGSPLLVLMNSDGRLAATLDVTAHKKPTLTLYDRDGKSRVVLAVDSDGSPALAMNDKTGTPRVGLAVATQGSGGLVLYGDRNAARASLGLGTDWSPYLVFLDDNGNVRTALGQSEALPPALTKTFRVADYSMMLLNAKGEMLWSAPEKVATPAVTPVKAAAKGKTKTGAGRR